MCLCTALIETPWDSSPTEPWTGSACSGESVNLRSGVSGRKRSDALFPDGFHLTLHACPNTRRCFSQVVMLSCIINSWKTTLVQPGPGMLKYKCPKTVSAFLIIWSLLVLLILLKLGMWLVTPQPQTADTAVRKEWLSSIVCAGAETCPTWGREAERFVHRKQAACCSFRF